MLPSAAFSRSPGSSRKAPLCRCGESLGAGVLLLFAHRLRLTARTPARRRPGADLGVVTSAIACISRV